MGAPGGGHAGARPGVTSEEAAEIRKPRREVAELRGANEILKAASVFFAVELDRPQPRSMRSMSAMDVRPLPGERRAACGGKPRAPTNCEIAERQQNGAVALWVLRSMVKPGESAVQIAGSSSVNAAATRSWRGLSVASS